jgi:hypothetical protein
VGGGGAAWLAQKQGRAGSGRWATVGWLLGGPREKEYGPKRNSVVFLIIPKRIRMV